ncbi:hypothetical protein HZS_2412, partial [Henneguya salminicola]
MIKMDAILQLLSSTQEDKINTMNFKINFTLLRINSSEESHTLVNLNIQINNILKLFNSTYGIYKEESPYFSIIYKISILKNLFIDMISGSEYNDSYLFKYDGFGRMICRNPNTTNPPHCNDDSFWGVPNPCQNNGVPTISTLSEKGEGSNKKLWSHMLICTCAAQYFGKICQNKYQCSNCKTNACGINNTCSACKQNWEGENCKTRKKDSYEICQNQGELEIKDEKIRCKCGQSFTGKHCELNCSRLCESKKCSIDINFMCHVISKTNILLFLSPKFLMYLSSILIMLLLIFVLSYNKILK